MRDGRHRGEQQRQLEPAGDREAANGAQDGNEERVTALGPLLHGGNEPAAPRLQSGEFHGGGVR